jgi:MFS family permease
MVDIKKIEKRAVQSFYDDGLVEIAVGLIFVLLSAYFLSQTIVPRGSSINAILMGLFMIVLVSSNFLGGRFVRFFKRRITYPRTGYVEFKKKEPSPRRRAAAAIAAGIIGASLAALYGLSSSVRTLIPASYGVLIGIAVFVIANRIRLVRFMVLSAVSTMIGVGIAVAGFDEIKGAFLYYLLFGLAVIASGLATLIIYLRRHPRPAAGGLEGPDAH